MYLTSFHEIPYVEQGDGARWKGSSRCRHLQGRPGSPPCWPHRSQPTQNCPLLSWCPSDVCSPQKDSSLPLCALQAASTPVRCPPPTQREFRRVSGLVLVFSPHPELVRIFSVFLPYSYGQSSRGEGSVIRVSLLCPFLRGGKPSMTAEIMSCSYTCVKEASQSALSCVEAELQLEAGTVPQEGRKAGKYLLTSQETGRAFRKLKWMSVPPETSQKNIPCSFLTS